jgi:hypothetical protein
MGWKNEPAAREGSAWWGRDQVAYVATGLSAERFGRTIRAPSTQEPNDDHAVFQHPCPLRQKLIDDMNMRHFSFG